jgi:hypothetical protein
METTDADMGDALAAIAKGVGRHGNTRAQVRQVLFVEFHHNTL